jgi:hypothetical protein
MRLPVRSLVRCLWYKRGHAALGGTVSRRRDRRQRRDSLLVAHHLPRHYRRWKWRSVPGRLQPLRRSRQLDRDSAVAPMLWRLGASRIPRAGASRQL